jgi:hypothetical protein
MRFSSACIFGICILQAGLLFSQVATNVSPYYPMGLDQLRYLNEAYQLGDQFISGGVLAVAHYLLSPSSPNGLLLTLEGGIAAALSGAHRSAALSVNIIVLIASEWFLFQSVKRQFSDASAWCAFTLFLLTTTPFLNAGGVFDFRIDFSAFCIFGIWTCTVLSSDIFLKRNVSVLAGLLAAWLVLTRFITFVYLGTIMGILIGAFALMWITRNDPLMKQRALNAGLSGSVLTVAVAPFFVINAKLIYNYYFVSLFVSSEAEIRALEFGVDSKIGHLLYYPKSLLFDHLGLPFASFAAACLFGAAIRHYWIRKNANYDWGRHAAALYFLMCVIVVPFVFVNLSASKSPVIISVICVPVVLLIAILVDTVLGRRSEEQLTGRWKDTTAGVLCVGIGLSVFLFRAAGPKCHLGVDACLEVNRFNDAIIKHARDNLADAPTFSSDGVYEMFNYLAVSNRTYEVPGNPVNFRPLYDMQVFAPTRESLLSAFARSDVVVLSDSRLGRNSVYPSNAVIEKNWEDLKSKVGGSMVSVARTNIAGVPYEAFSKPNTKITGLSGEIAGLSGGWITSAGIDLPVNSRIIGARPYLVLEGEALLQPLGGTPDLHAELRDPGGKVLPMTLPAKIAISDGLYKIVIDCSTACAKLPEPTIHLTFDRFFVPSKAGINTDTRELVLYAPSTRTLTVQE